MSTTTTSPSPPPTWPIRKYTPRHPSWPYTAQDFSRHDPTADSSFYASPRFVTHIDDAAIASLREYYAHVLPPFSEQEVNPPQLGNDPPKKMKMKRILDLCSSWTSHFPPHVLDAVKDGRLEVWGLGMNARELERNPVFSPYDGGKAKWGIWDLNREGKGDVGVALGETLLKNTKVTGEQEEEELEVANPPPLLDATTCVVSTDYLVQPLTVFASLLHLTQPGGSVHLTVSNRCFPTKAISRWLQVDEAERLQMVGDYLFFAGWKDIEIVELSDGRVRGPGEDGDGGSEEQGTGADDGGLGAFMRALGMDAARKDPLWVVRGVKE
ncbi:hypothetical protein NU219Hw_g2724t1 [Hortaea werneckii]